MIKVRVGRREEGDGNIKYVFRGNYEDEWFDDPFVKELVMEVDKSEVVSPYLIISPVLGPISFENLSGGVKILIMLYKMPEMEQWGTSCGDNCLPAMARIGKMQDIQVKYSHCPAKIPEEMEVQFVDSGEYAKGDKDIGLGISRRMNWGAKKW